MSMTLILWKAPVVDDADEAKRLLRPWLDHEDTSRFEPSPDVTGVYQRLREKYPDDPSPESDLEDKCPWADTPIRASDRLLVLDIRWSADPQVLDDITALARLHGLVLYDPQGPDLHLPTDPIEELAEAPAPRLLDWLHAVGLALLLIGLTYAATLIPFWWLRWPAMLVFGFFAAAAIFLVGAMILERRILNQTSSRE